MASLHNQSYSDFTFSSESCQYPPYLISNQTTAVPTGLFWKGDQENLPMFDQTTPYTVDIAESKCDAMNMSMPPDQLLTSFDYTLLSTLPDDELKYLEMCGMDGAPQNYYGNNGGYGSSNNHQSEQEAHEFSGECCEFMPEFDTFRNASQINFHAGGIQVQRTPITEDTSMKVGRYSAEERKDRILRYLKKRNQRNFNKTIKYACRKTLADRRVRVRGRFARNNELSDEAEVTTFPKQETPLLQNDLYFCDAIHQISMKQEEEVWMQEAMASLMYLPYIG